MSETKPCEGCGALIHLAAKRPSAFRAQRFCSTRCNANWRGAVGGHVLPPVPDTWTDQRVADLEVLWAEGLSATAIAQRLGTTKNAVVGKAHRMCLPGRPSPVKRRREPEPYVAPIVEAPAPLAGGCLYAMWADGAKPDHTYCGAPRKRGSVLCPDHHELCWVPVKSKRGARMSKSIERMAEKAAPPSEEAA